MKYILILALSMAGWTNCLFAQQDASEQDRWILSFVPGISVQEKNKICSEKGLKIVEDFYPLNIVLVEPESKLGVMDFKSLDENPEIMDAQKDLYIKWINESPVSIENIPFPSVESIKENVPEPPAAKAGRAYGEIIRQDTEIPWGIARLNAPAAWARTMGAGVKVAIIDTGIDATHPDLKGRVAGGITYYGDSWADDHSHGTHVAGIIAASRDGNGVAGVAPEASLYAVKVLDENGGSLITTIIRGILWAAKNEMDVANLSLGARIPFFPLHLAVMHANSKGVTLVAAAGNDAGGVNWPARYGDVIAVSALAEPDKIASFSSRGKQVEFIAPGVGVRSTIPGGYASYSGTSMASPHVAGLAALAIASGAKNPDAVRAALTKAAVPITGLTATEQGSGVVNAATLVTR